MQERADELSGAPARGSFFALPSLLAGMALSALVAVPATYYALKQPALGPTVVQMAAERDAGEEQPLFAYSVTPGAPRAFGDLESLDVSQANGSRAQGGGGGAGGMPAPDVAIDSKMMIWQPYQIQYAFSGSLSSLGARTVDVLKRQKGPSAVQLPRLADVFSLGNVDLTSFQPARVNSVTFVQDTPYGYMIDLQLGEGTVSVHQNWERWPMQDIPQPLKKSDVPPESELVAIADAFLRSHGVDLSHYGEGEVDDAWHAMPIGALAAGAEPWIPGVQQVRYPLLVEGKPVYDQSGMTSGITVGVNVRAKKVSEMWGIANQSYVSSSYEAVTDAQAVTEYLAQLDRTPAEFLPKDAKTATVTLGQPTEGYAVYYVYDGKTGAELTVPSLIFPVISAPDDLPYRRRSVEVPLAKDVLAKQTQQFAPAPPDLVRPL